MLFFSTVSTESTSTLSCPSIDLIISISLYLLVLSKSAKGISLLRFFFRYGPQSDFRFSCFCSKTFISFYLSSNGSHFFISCIIQSYIFFKFTSKSYHKKYLCFYVQQIFLFFIFVFSFFYFRLIFINTILFYSLSFIFFNIYTTLFLSLKIFAGLSARYLKGGDAFSWRMFWVCYICYWKLMSEWSFLSWVPGSNLNILDGCFIRR